MPTPTSDSHSSQAPLASNTQTNLLTWLFLGVSLGAGGLIFGLLMRGPVHQPRSGQPAAKHQAAAARPAATPPQEIAVEAASEPEDVVRAAPTLLPDTGEETPRRDSGRKSSFLDAPPRLPEALTADQVLEQRLRASEGDLRVELRDVPEVRFMSDPDVKRVRKAERTAQRPVVEEPRDPEACRAQLNAAQARLKAAEARLTDAQAALRAGRITVAAYNGAVRVYQKVVPHYNQIVRRCTPRVVLRRSPQEQEEIGYEFNLDMHRTLKRAAVQAGLALQSGSDGQLDVDTAADMGKLSKSLRNKGFVTVPGVPFVRGSNGGVVIDGGGVKIGGVVIAGGPRGSSVNGQRLGTPGEGAEDKRRAFQTWCDRHGLERRKGTVPTLTQMLQIEDEATRLLLVRELTRSRGESAATELAVRAIVDLSPAVRQAALAGLEQRPSSQYVPVLLRGLRYPWTPVADHAAVALRTLAPQEAVAPLVGLLDLPSPSAPVYDAPTRQYRVREVVRLNHLRNCLLCHAPSADKFDGVVRGLVPTPGEALPFLYYASQGGDFVRADRTFLRQDFSVNLPEKDAAPWPNEQRYDFVTRLRTASPGEVAELSSSSANYPQRDAVLYALRGLTGKDGGTSSARWRELLGRTAAKPKGEKMIPALKKFVVSKTDTGRLR